MALPPPDSSHTPPHTPFNERSVISDSMEDLDPSATRKRPRLDSGSRVSPSLSMEGTSRTASIAPSLEMEETSDSGNPSKVTINTKPTLDPTMAPDLPSSDTELPDSSRLPLQSANNVISLPSSPSTSQSPEIEVADPEDINQDPKSSNWRVLGQTMRNPDEPEIIEIQDVPRLGDTFPKAHPDMTKRDNFKLLAELLEQGNLRGGAALVKIGQWLSSCVHDLDRLTFEEYAADSEFWELLPSVLDSLLRRHLRLHLDDVDAVANFFEQFLLNYAQIALQLIKLDSTLLEITDKHEDLTELPPHTSGRYIITLPWLFQGPQIPFFQVLEKQFGIGAYEISAALKAQLSAPPCDAPSVLLQYASHLLALLPKCPKLIVMLPGTLVSLLAIFDCDSDGSPSNESDSSVDWETVPTSIQRFYEIVRGIDEAYQTFIAKKSQVANNDVTETLMNPLFRSYRFLCSRYPELLAKFARDLSIQIPEDADADQATLCAIWSWKLGTLKKEIMEGRMELRVHGVELMQSDLVLIWSQNNSQNEKPFLRYMVEYLRQSNILDYLVGIDSHPQLISRSSNIFGFLIVMDRYTNHDTDIIWKTVTESQDDRTICEVLRMLSRTLPMHPSNSKGLLYLCSKLLELPLDRFDSRIIEFCESLIPRIRERQIDRDRDFSLIPNEKHVDSIPLKLCVRLIRESSGAKDLSVEQRQMMQQFGTEQLAQFIKAGLNETDKAETYERCIQDIGEMNECTAGSIQVLNVLVPYGDARELWNLANDFDLTRLVVTELHHLVSRDHAKVKDLSSRHGFSARVELLRRLIDLAPETISPDLGNILWNNVLMSQNLAPEERQTVWKMLVDLTNRIFKENPFIERCIHEYLPSVPPKEYSHEVLWLTQQSVYYEIRVKSPPIVGDNEVIDIPGMDRIWNLILTALPQTIETEAIKFAISSYLDHSIIRRSPRSAIDATHIALVNRCVDQLKAAAAVLKPSSDEGTAERGARIGAESSNGDPGTDELTFSRSLQFLRQLLHGLRTRPQYSSPHSSPPMLPERPLKGEPVEIRYQCFNGSSSSAIRSMRIGGLSTASELVQMLVHLSRFSKFTAILGGQKLELLQDPHALVKDLKLSSGLLILRKAPDAQEITLAGKRQCPTAVDNEVLKHLDELYDLLDLKDDLARQIIDFLVVFPPQAHALKLVRSKDSSEKDLFPLHRPFKAMYSLHTMSLCLQEEAVEISPDQNFISHSAHVLAAFLISNELSTSMSSASIAMVLATRAIACLLLTISVLRPSEDEIALIVDPISFVPRVLELLEMGQNIPTNIPAATCAHGLICNSFAVLVESSLRDINVWHAVKQIVQFDELISSLLLKEERQSVRADILERLKIICGPLKPLKLSMKETGAETPPTENPIRIDMLATIWASFLQVIPKTVEHVPQSEEFFRAALWMFRTVAYKSPRDLVFNDYLRQWSIVMLSHHTEEFVGRELADNLVIGFSDLLELCLELADTAGMELDTLNIAEEIFNQYLFPDLSPDEVELAVPQIPVMHASTRSRLYSVVSLLCKQSDVTCHRVLRLLDTIVPRDSEYLDNGCERALMLRSPQGYAGLRNLSNTCYLNSLITQLFMNIDFRHFMLKLPIADRASQKLLHETQRLFTCMQETWGKSVDPSAFVKSILTYENTGIDVSIQMDVDEFYNLLFDRWEAQVLDPEQKKTFRSFYGGQLVQQIKSMECDHISERLEPFSAIQCEIKGKATLEDSLRAYVAGEVMQGDNKYSCTACERHVNAVKRACLKDVPDNLIFHLKRFDFDMVNMLRSKINDEFQFPHHIDMTPYTVEHLSDPEQAIAPDMFKLVGILVHTGTAESGHYYSYTLERPSPSGKASWVEFNDSDVSKFDPTGMATQCFGGLERDPNAAPRDRQWNAYMLFYQRVCSIEKSKEVFEPVKPGIPVHLPVSMETQNRIALENEMLIRVYCLLDPEYPLFVAKLLHRCSRMSYEKVDRKRAEALAVHVGMETIEQLIPRIKEAQGLPEVYSELVDMIDTSPNAALSILEWALNRQSSMYNIMIKTTNTEIRGKELLLINCALKRLHSLLTDPDLDDEARTSWGDRFDEAIQRLVPMFTKLWPDVQWMLRVWEDYFGFIMKLCDYGTGVVNILLDQGHLLTCLEIIWIDNEDRKRLQNRHPDYVRLLNKGRRFNYQALLSLCLTLFKYLDLSLCPTPISGHRQYVRGKFSSNIRENDLIKTMDDDRSLPVLLRIMRLDSMGSKGSGCAFIGILLDGEPDAGLLDPIRITLETGLRFEPARQCAPYLEGAVTFCQRCPDKQQVNGMIEFVAKGVETINNSGGQEHLDFFINLCHASNERLGMDSAIFTELVLENIPLWAPTLLIDTSETLRQRTQNFVDEILFHDGEKMDLPRPCSQTISDDGEEIDTLDDERDNEAQECKPQNCDKKETVAREPHRSIGRILLDSCIERLKDAFLNDQIQQVDPKQLENIISVMNHCLACCFDESDANEKLEQVNALFGLLRSMSLEDVPDDPPSDSDVASIEDWDANSVIASDSDVGVAGSP